MTGSRPSDELGPGPLQLAAAADPATAFREAHATGRLLDLATSGTAGHPRRVLRTTASWVDSFEHVSRLAEIGAGSRVWIPGPLSATMNLFALVHADWAGARLSDDLASATHAHLTPSRLVRLLADRPAELAGIHLVTAGDRLEPRVHDAAVAAGARVSHYYGAAELSFVAWGPHAEALFRFPGVQIEIRDGRIWVRSPYTCREGGSAPPSPGSRTPESRVPHPRMPTSDTWMTVGDRGVLDHDGRLVVHGREGAITTSGSTVLAADIEHELRSAAIGQVVVIGMPHPDLGEVVAAVLTDPADLDAVRDHARARLSAAHRPRRWLHLAPLPLTESAKIDRTAIVRTVAEGRAQRLH